MLAAGMPEWLVAGSMEMYEIIDNPHDVVLTSMSGDLQRLLASQLQEEPLQNIDRFIVDFFASSMGHSIAI
jgi:hypothetical protein